VSRRNARGVCRAAGLSRAVAPLVPHFAEPRREAPRVKANASGVSSRDREAQRSEASEGEARQPLALLREPPQAAPQSAASVGETVRPRPRRSGVEPSRRHRRDAPAEPTARYAERSVVLLPSSIIIFISKLQFYIINSQSFSNKWFCNGINNIIIPKNKAFGRRKV